MKDAFAQLLHAPCTAMALAMQDLGIGAARVERDPAGLPIAWQLFPFGQVQITQGGESLSGTFTPDMADSIVAFAAEKNMPVPIDAEHALAHLATMAGVEESDLLAAIPSGKLAIGFGQLAKRADGLWLTAVEWTDVGRALMATGAFRWHSPVLRGRSDGRYRVTSDSVTNNPAINDLDALVAEADDTMERDTLSLSDLTGATTPPNKGEQPNMDKLLELLGALVGNSDAIALSDGGELPADVMQSLTAIKDELPALRQAKTDGDAFLLAARDALALGADADLKVVEGHILALAEKASTADALKSQVDKLALESETRKKDELKATGLAAGKLSAKQVESPWFQGLDSVQLDAFLEHAPKVVPVGPPTDPDKLPEDDAVILTDVQKQVAASGGYTKEQMIEAVKRQRKQEAATS